MEPKPRELSLTQLVPNLMTISAMCSGLTGIRFAVDGQFPWAVAMILLAAVLDGLDGRVARLLKSESEMGAELDSFVDFVNFGVATGLIVYLWGLAGQQSGGWIATLLYASCCMLRLARFNIGNRADKAEGEVAATFTGVPAPAGAMLALLPLYVAFIWPGAVVPPFVLMLWILLVGGLMISRIPTPSFKSVTVLAENVRFVVVGFVTLVAALLTFPWQTMLAIDLAYIAIVLKSLWQFRKNRRGLRGL
jgi:CDP-diacylglycerol--serine O-phosphatidyltransferase